LDDSEKQTLDELVLRGTENKVPGLRILQGKDLVKMEPGLSRKSVAGLYAPTAGIVCPYEAAYALSENAAANGAKIMTQTKVTGIHVRNGEVESVRTDKGTIRAHYVVNAAGLFSDEVSAMAGVEGVRIIPRKGEYVIYDKSLGSLVSHVLFPVPNPVSKGILVSPTIDGNLMAGPNAHDVECKDDFATTPSGIAEVLDGACMLMPKLSRSRSAVITSFAGLRAEPVKGDFIIEFCEEPRGFINVAGIKSPGLTSAPAIARKVVSMLSRELELRPREGFRPGRTSIPHPLRDLDHQRVEELMATDPTHGRVVCRCEQVSEGEIREAIRRGATTLDGLKYRTRVGMGRCQGEFCTPRLMKILSAELGIPFKAITKRGAGSNIVQYAAKELLTGEGHD
jgi:glycerol-3-phosphate dehydrogenase